ncbi:DUF4843 domain-containing protein [Polaribacter sp. Asnod1-A03]|uniref:DUF4843 domain-containing protein n=1 Tax=Polaribacter sp. Asnod1-A03 TaxID=3160581 RepID=UPI0038673BBB
MKNYIKIIMTLFVIALVMTACEEEKIAIFNGNEVVYFRWAIDGRGSATQKTDSIAYTFAYELPSEVTSSLISVPLKAQGFMSDTDRSVTVKVMDESTAQKGIHYTIAEDIMIPANAYVGYIPVTFNRTDDMKDEVLTLKLQLLENENFKVDLYGEEVSYNSDRVLSYSEFEITVSDILTEPDIWYQLERYIGPFSVKKFYLFAEVNEMPLPDYSVSFDWATFWAQVDIFRAYLEAQRNAGTPVLEEDGTEMVLG